MGGTPQPRCLEGAEGNQLDSRGPQSEADGFAHRAFGPLAFRWTMDAQPMEAPLALRMVTMPGRALGTEHRGLEVHKGASSPLRCRDAMTPLDITSTFSIQISAIHSPRDAGRSTHLRLDWASVDTHDHMHRGLRRRGAQQWLGQELAGTTVWLF